MTTRSLTSTTSSEAVIAGSATGAHLRQKNAVLLDKNGKESDLVRRLQKEKERGDRCERSVVGAMGEKEAQ